jgi:hypothetical protein
LGRVLTTKEELEGLGKSLKDFGRFEIMNSLKDLGRN